MKVSHDRALCCRAEVIARHVETFTVKADAAAGEIEVIHDFQVPKWTAGDARVGENQLHGGGPPSWGREFRKCCDVEPVVRVRKDCRQSNVPIREKELSKQPDVSAHDRWGRRTQEHIYIVGEDPREPNVSQTKERQGPHNVRASAEK